MECLSSSDSEISTAADYKLACELGYELSKTEYYDLYKYAKLVQSEYSTSTCNYERPIKKAKSSCILRSGSSYSSVSLSNKNTENQNCNEDLWIKYLRERLNNESRGLGTPVFDSIKAREFQIQNDVRKRRLASLSKLPKLPDNVHNFINQSLTCLDSAVIIQKFCIPITPKDLRTLISPNWLNDEVVNFYFELLCQRSKENVSLPRLQIFNTFFYSKLKTSGYASVKRWTRKSDIFSCDMILIPIHLGIHWCCAEINIKERTIFYYDSLHNSNNKCLHLLKDYLVEEHKDKKGTDGSAEFDLSNWIISSPKGIPGQQNGYDCGVFACIFAEYRSRNVEFTFSQKDMKYFRDRISYEIITGRLL